MTPAISFRGEKPVCMQWDSGIAIVRDSKPGKQCRWAA